MSSILINEATAFEAAESQLKTLCLSEFPCGLGSWRDEPSEKLNKKCMKKKPQVKPKHKLDPNLSDKLSVNPQEESKESLKYYLNSSFSPWHLEYNWSKEADKLREIAVENPLLINKKFLLSYFKTLRIVDKQVVEIDKNLLSFKNLEQLCLSSNAISEVNSRNLPKTLRVLELFANRITDISGLILSPPPLIHLGLGMNKISIIEDFITAQYWPELLSLDLSFNDLADFTDVIYQLSLLPKLRNLILQGNPLSLVPSYRGYTVDSIRDLITLDDQHVTADEKHHFKGLARRKEFIVDEIKVSIQVQTIKGLPNPKKEPQHAEEYPVVERMYFLQFMFPVDTRPKPILSPEIETIPEEDEFFSENVANKNLEVPQEANEPVVSANDVEKQESKESVKSEILEDVIENEQEESKCYEKSTSEKFEGLRLEPVSTEPKAWARQITLDWSVDLTRINLLEMRNFLQQGMTINVVEQITELNPSTKSARETPDTKKKEKAAKNKQTANNKKPDSGKKDDKKKKKKSVELDLERSPPTFNVMTSFHMPLTAILEGSFEISQVFQKEPDPAEVPEVPADVDEVKKKADSAKKQEKASSKPAVKDDKGKGKDDKKGKKKQGDDEDLDDIPCTLEFDVNFSLHHWKTAMDSIPQNGSECTDPLITLENDDQ